LDNWQIEIIVVYQILISNQTPQKKNPKIRHWHARKYGYSVKR